MKNPPKTSYSVVKYNVFPIRSERRQGHLVNIGLKVLAGSLRQESEVKGIEFGNE